MSTEAASPSVAALEKLKRKKNKTYHKESSKKRKRESSHHEADHDDERSSKKEKKKRKHDESQSSLEPEAQPQSEVKVSKKHKKDKSNSKTTKDATEDPYEELLKKHSPFLQQTTSFYLSLSPCASAFPLEGLCAEHLSPLLLTYYPPLRGIVLAYKNARMSTERPDLSSKDSNSSTVSKKVLSRSIDEYGVTFVWLTADFLLCRPKKGTWIEGFVNLQNESLLGLVCYNYFNAVIEREKLPKDWRWIDEDDPEHRHVSPKKKQRKFGESDGYFTDGKGDRVDGRLVFRVEDFEASAGIDGGGGSVSIVGSLIYDGNKT